MDASFDYKILGRKTSVPLGIQKLIIQTNRQTKKSCKSSAVISNQLITKVTWMLYVSCFMLYVFQLYNFFFYFSLPIITPNETPSQRVYDRTGQIWEISWRGIENTRETCLRSCQIYTITHYTHTHTHCEHSYSYKININMFPHLVIDTESLSPLYYNIWRCASSTNILCFFSSCVVLVKQTD